MASQDVQVAGGGGVFCGGALQDDVPVGSQDPENAALICDLLSDLIVLQTPPHKAMLPES
uniref:Uncharacterized protein n=1 Tax=Anguilla anguilla TaxID=7936 RepID=A0A0E9QXV8_ANGAN